jgi:hypothetical protein
MTCCTKLNAYIILTSTQSTIPSHNTSPQCPSYDHHHPRNHLPNPKAVMDTANKAAVCLSRAMDTTCTPRLVAS